MCKFLWGGGADSKKIVWVKWEELCLQHKFGGLGLKNLEWFNSALVGKWLWRFLVERESLWARVVRARHGEVVWDEEGFKVTGSRSSQLGWWNKVVDLSRGVGGKGFRENLAITLGDGENFLFWHHIWVGESSLKSAFPRLFRLCTNQGGTIKSMGNWVEGVWVWTLGWRRALLERENNQVDMLYSILNNVVMVAGSKDTWRWNASPNGVYSTKTAYEVFNTSHLQGSYPPEDKLFVAIWKAPAPLKAITTAWRILRGRMATCDNLAKRKVDIPVEQAKCVACKSQAETANHFLIQCEETTMVWHDIIKWTGMQM